MIYNGFGAYIQCEKLTSIQRIKRIEEVLNKLYDALLESAGRAVIREYEIDSGQSKVVTKYRSVKNISDDITALEMLRNRLHMKVYGTRAVALRPPQGVGQRAIRSRG